MAQARLTLLASILAVAALGGCSRDRTVNAAATAPTAAPAAAPQPSMPMMAPTAGGATASGTVVETMDASSYTYVRVKTATGDIWAAATTFKVKVGDKVVVPLNMPMQNFRSGTLNRTFPLVYFASRIEREGEAGAAPMAAPKQ